jgi:predicted kinase
MLVVFRGLPGTGKSHLVRRLVKSRPELLVLSRDSIRAGMIPRPTFAADEKNLVDDLILSMAGFLLDRGRDVVIDGMALSSARRVQEFFDAARVRGTPCHVIECSCSETTALGRIRRDKGGHPAGDRGERLYHEVKARFEPFAGPFLSIDTESDVAGNLRAILDYVGRGPDHAGPGPQPVSR